AVASRSARASSAGDAEVFLLHQYAVVEACAVVAAAAAANRVFLESTQAGRRLSRVEDGRGGSLGQLDEAAGQRRDAAEPAEQVECDAFAAEDRACGPLDHG